MPRPPLHLSTAGGSQFEPLEENIDLAPADPVAMQIVQEILRLVGALAAPRLTEVAKSVAALGGLAWQRRKAERAKDLILGLYEKVQRMPVDYLKKEEAEDILEDILRRVSEQPDASRRESIKRIFLKIIEEPREHVENRLLLRLADELPSRALQALALLELPLTKEERDNPMGGYILATRMGEDPHHLDRLINHLVNENIVDERQLGVSAGFGAAGNDLMYLLTPLGRAFVEYARR